MVDLKGKKVLVVGLADSGYAAAEFLSGLGAVVKVTEIASTAEMIRRAGTLERLGIAIEMGGHSRAFCADAALVVVSPGADIRAKQLASVMPENVPIISELELGAMFAEGPIIAVTGTNGKSTTTELIGTILSSAGKKAVVCGNIGPPIVGKAHELGPDSIAVVEVSSFQLETISAFRPKVAVLLNITEDHYERHRTYENYKREKFKIFKNQGKDDWAVVLEDFQRDRYLDGIKSHIVFFGGDNGLLKVEDGAIVESGKGKDRRIMDVRDIPLTGRHNLENVLSAITVSKIMGIDNPDIKKAVISFKGLKHRIEKVAVIGGVEYVDDSKATNIDAAKRALESMGERVVLIAGGRDKGGDYTSILPLVNDKVKVMVLIGEAAKKMQSVFEPAVRVITADTMEEAVMAASGHAAPGETVLLSPMCSSFDMFTSYKDRGDTFRRAVLTMREKPRVS